MIEHIKISLDLKGKVVCVLLMDYRVPLTIPFKLHVYSYLNFKHTVYHNMHVIMSPVIKRVKLGK